MLEEGVRESMDCWLIVLIGQGMQPVVRLNWLPAGQPQTGQGEDGAVFMPTLQRQVDWSRDGSMKRGQGRHAWPVL